jgi:hypothetical protein
VYSPRNIGTCFQTTWCHDCEDHSIHVCVWNFSRIIFFRDSDSSCPTFMTRAKNMQSHVLSCQIVGKVLCRGYPNICDRTWLYHLLIFGELVWKEEEKGPVNLSVVDLNSQIR